MAGTCGDSDGSEHHDHLGSQMYTADEGRTERSGT